MHISIEKEKKGGGGELNLFGPTQFIAQFKRTSNVCHFSQPINGGSVHHFHAE